MGIVTGNPSGCFDKTLPDAYNFVGNEKVRGKFRSKPSRRRSYRNEIDEKAKKNTGFVY